jgi:class 3 adenylate cyclase
MPKVNQCSAFDATREFFNRIDPQRTRRQWTIEGRAYNFTSLRCLKVSAHMADERVQRRLAAILAADVAGYSRLMGADEEGTLL